MKALSTIETKHFSTLALIGLCYCILNSWTAASAAMSIALVSGGPSVTLWGMLVAFVGVMACALSLAEICHVYPTTGGQYHLAYLLSPARWQYVIAYFTGWIAVAGWVALTATASSLAGQFIVGIIALLHAEYESKPWHIFLVHVVFSLGAWVVNAFGVRILDTLNRVAMVWSLVAVVAIMSVVAWFVQGRNEFKGPLDMDEILFRTRGFARFDAEEAAAARAASEKKV